MEQAIFLFFKSIRNKIYWKHIHYTDKNIFDNSYYLVKHFPDFPLWENRIAYLPKVKYLK